MRAIAIKEEHGFRRYAPGLFDSSRNSRPIAKRSRVLDYTPPRAIGDRGGTISTSIVNDYYV